MTVHTIFSTKDGHLPVPPLVSRLGIDRVVALLRPIAHQHGFIYLKDHSKTKNHHVYMPLFDVDFWYRKQMLALSAEQRIAFISELQTQHEDRSDSVQQSLIMGYTGPGFVTSILLHGDAELSRDFPGLMEGIRQRCLNYP